jgi:hypothetical protein
MVWFLYVSANIGGDPQITAKQAQLKGEPPKNFDWRTKALVQAACDRWLDRHAKLP